MKFKTLLSVILGGCAFTAMAQGGYQDGVDYYNADRFEQAKIILDNTLNDASTDKAVSYFYLGSIDLREGNTQAAKANFDKGVAANPAYGYNYVGLGEIALKNGDKSAAEKLFKEAMATDKKDAALTAAVARAYFNVDPVLYKKEIDKNVAKALKDSKNLEPAVYVLQGDMIKASDIGQAAGYYEQAMTYDEQAGHINPEAYVKYSNLYNKVNPSFAISKLEELNQKLPTSALAQRELAEKYYDGNQFTKAAQQYGKYMSNPNHFQNDEQRYSGLLYFGKDYKKSLELANQVLAKDPENVYMHRMVMLNKAALEDYAGAAEAAQKLFAAPNTTFTATDYMTYGDVLGALNRPDEAIAAYTKAYELNPEKNKSVLVSISSMYTDAENYAKAAEVMQQYVDMGDASLTDYYTLSNRYKNLALSLPEESPERVEAANNGIKYIDLALESAAEESKGMLLQNKASLLMTRDGTNPTDELVDTYKAMVAAYDLDPENKVKRAGAYKSAYGFIANDYRIKKDDENARLYFEKLLEIDPENQAVRDYLKK
ncbi:MAG: tetratricopeptide repeat protein [Duncaniella sp.]|nr:tetratricopeptide repeat protein [Duncaniella sp.]